MSDQIYPNWKMKCGFEQHEFWDGFCVICGDPEGPMSNAEFITEFLTEPEERKEESPKSKADALTPERCIKCGKVFTYEWDCRKGVRMKINVYLDGWGATPLNPKKEKSLCGECK